MAANQLRAVERLVTDALKIVDEQHEHLIGALLDEALHLIRAKIEDLAE